ncbi:MAG: response regulator, partial [Oscillospiraceae bacterium]
EVTRKIRKYFDKDTVIVIISAYDVMEIETEAIEAGANMVIPKPLFQSTVFNVLITLMDGKVNVSPASNKYDFSGKRVLLAEDNEINSEIAVELLNMVNIKVDVAENGKIAYEMFKHSQEGTYDAILMDVQMPIMDGYHATREIRSSLHPQAKTIPIFAMTADAFAEDVAAAVASGMNGHISKPIDIDILYKTLSKI